MSPLLPPFGEALFWKDGRWTYELIPQGAGFRWTGVSDDDPKKIVQEFGLVPGGIYRSVYSLLELQAALRPNGAYFTAQRKSHADKLLREEELRRQLATVDNSSEWNHDPLPRDVEGW